MRAFNRTNLPGLVAFAMAMALVCLSSCAARGAEVTFEWDRSLSVGVTNYTLRVGPASSTNATINLQTGTNLTQTVTLPAGSWRVWVLAVAGGVSSDPSNFVLVDVPLAPTLRIKLQAAATVTGPWRDVASYGVEPAAEVGLYRLEIARGQ